MSDDIGRREFLKRGALAGAAVTTAVPLPSEPEAGRGAGALPETITAATPMALSADLANRHLDSKDFCLAQYETIVPRTAFSATTPSAARRWQVQARRRVVERLGGFPATRVPLRAEVLERREFGSYTREQIVFDTRANLSALGYLLVPKHRGSEPLPVVVAFAGHGRGLSDILGPLDDAAPRAERSAGYAREYAMQCVEHGYATFAVEQLAFGMRRDDAARRAGPTENSCRQSAGAALLFGQSMAGWRVWDAMRAIDYLGTRSELDVSRIATMGASGGATTALFTAAVDPRVKAAVVSAYFNTFRHSIVSISHCPDNYVPGLLQEMEMHDLAGLIAPRALFVESGRNDRIFPIEGSRIAAERARSIYATFGVPDRMGYQVHEGGHEFHGVGAFEHLKRWL